MNFNLEMPHGLEARDTRGDAMKHAYMRFVVKKTLAEPLACPSSQPDHWFRQLLIHIHFGATDGEIAAKNHTVRPIRLQRRLDRLRADIQNVKDSPAKNAGRYLPVDKLLFKQGKEMGYTMRDWLRGAV